jgi:hypothetical protein
MHHLGCLNGTPQTLGPRLRQRLMSSRHASVVSHSSGMCAVSTVRNVCALCFPKRTAFVLAARPHSAAYHDSMLTHRQVHTHGLPVGPRLKVSRCLPILLSGNRDCQSNVPVQINVTLRTAIPYGAAHKTVRHSRTDNPERCYSGIPSEAAARTRRPQELQPR